MPILIRKICVLFSNGLAYALMKIFGRFMIVRIIARGCIRKEKKVICGDDVFQIKNPDKLLVDLKKFGFSRELEVSQAVIDELVQFAHNNPVHAYMDKNLAFSIKFKDDYQKQLGEDILVAFYPNLHEVKIFEDICNNPVLLNIARRYCGVSAECIASQMWWTFPADVNDEVRNKYAHFFHRDLDGYNFIKLFIYLTDVLQGDGGHFFVAGSHKLGFIGSLKERFRISRIADEIVYQRFGSASVIEMTGAPGTVIVEDTFGLHKGQTPTKNPRLIASFVFGTRNYNNIQKYIA